MHLSLQGLQAKINSVPTFYCRVFTFLPFILKIVQTSGVTKRNNVFLFIPKCRLSYLKIRKYLLSSNIKVGLFSWKAIRQQDYVEEYAMKYKKIGNMIHEAQLKYFSLLCVRT